MEPLVKGDELQIYLPFGFFKKNAGFFKMEKKSLGFNDDYILDVAASANYRTLSNSELKCQNVFFKGLREQIKLKASLKTLSSVTTHLRRHKTQDTRLYCLWFLSKVITERQICKDIVVLAKLW